MNTMYELQYHPLTGELFCVINTVSGARIPVAPDNKDYQEYLKWLNEGNQPITE